MLKYWKQIQESQYVYSCDMVRVSFKSMSDHIQYLAEYFGNPCRMDITNYPPNFSSFKYKYLYVLDCGESTATIGLCFNGTSREENLNGFIEFNPNKCMGYQPLVDDIAVIVKSCYLLEITRFDLAIDIPKDRENVFMVKDSRKYSLEQNSYSSRTEYLGQRNSAGRVKLYNKSVESNLNYPLTRLEITFGKTNNLETQWDKYVPDVFCTDGQIDLLLSDELSNTQMVLVQLLRNSDNPSYYLKLLDYRMAKKIEPYVFGENTRLNFNSKILYKIVSNLEELFNMSHFKAFN